jgi:hypothetical protein
MMHRIISLSLEQRYHAFARVDHITIKDTSTLAHKLNLTALLPSDWLALASSSEIVSVGKVSDGEAVFIMPDR